YLVLGRLILSRSDPEGAILPGEEYCCAGARLRPGAVFYREPGSEGGYRVEFHLVPQDGEPYLARL
ncbi:MAG: hypothetical protein AB7F32_05365, partial [Victivallaceae bacterium]